MDLPTLAQTIVGGIAAGSTYALAGLGLILILNTTSVPNFAHGEIGLLGTYLGLTVATTLSVSNLLTAWIGMGVAVIAGAAVGVLAGAVLMWRARGRTLVGTVVVTLGLFFAIHAIVVIIWGPGTRQYPSLFTDNVLRLGPVAISWQSLGVTAIAGLSSLALAAWLRYARVGTYSRAIVQNEVGAAVIGLNTRAIKLLMWAIGSAFSGLACALIAPSSFLTPNTMLNVIVLGFAAATLGGLGSLPGVFVGGLIVGVIQSLVGVYISGTAASAAGLVVILAVLLIRPAGLLGRAYVEKV